MSIFTKENFDFVTDIIRDISILATATFFLVGKFPILIAWNRKRKCDAIDREIARLRKLSDSDRELIIFLSRSGFLVVAAISISIMFSVTGMNDRTRDFSTMLQFASSGLAYSLAAYTLGNLRRLTNSEKEIEKLLKQKTKNKIRM